MNHSLITVNTLSCSFSRNQYFGYEQRVQMILPLRVCLHEIHVKYELKTQTAKEHEVRQ